MKNLVLLHLILLLFACNQSNESDAKGKKTEETRLETKTKEEPVNEEETISDIKEKFKGINQNTASYEIKSMELMGESTEGGELKGYYQNDELKKVVASYFGEMGKSVEEYYFYKNHVFFAFSQDYSYDIPMTVEGSKVDKIDENRYYFRNSKLVRWVDPNKERVSSSKFNTIESDIFQKIASLKKKLETGHFDSPKNSVDYIDMESLFSLSPLSIFDKTTDGLSLSEKKDLLKNGESTSWKIIAASKAKLELRSKDPSSEVTFYFLKNMRSLDGVLFTQVVNGKNVDLLSWKYSNEGKTLQETNLLRTYSANDFVSKEDKLPDSYEPVLQYSFIDDQTIEVSLHTWMEEEFENREIINKILLKWNGEGLEEVIKRINK